MSVKKRIFAHLKLYTQIVLVMKDTRLWRATGWNTLISIGLFGVLFLLLWAAESFIPAVRGQLLHFTAPAWADSMGEMEYQQVLNNWRAWIVGIPASVVGVAYILSIKNPDNYTGFYAGIVMSVLLGVQFWLQGQYDSTFLYFCVFIPFQVLSIVNWSKPKQTADEVFAPEFLKMKGMLLSLLVCVVITFADYLLATYCFQHNGLADNVAVKLCNALLISSSVLANFWLIYKKNDAWLYWILYSVAGIVLFVLIGNIFSVVLFLFFLVINSTAGVAWIGSTPKENQGWIRGR